MKTPLGTEVDLGPGHIVLDGSQLPRERDTAASSLAYVYCGHGHPSQLLSTCQVVASYLPKVASFNLYPPAFSCLRWGWPRLSFAEIYGVWKLETLVWCCLC